MSRAYNFYPAVCGEDGIEPLYRCKDGTPGVVFCCNGRGIDFPDIIMANKEKFSEPCRSFFAENYAAGTDLTYVYKLTGEYLEKESGGLVSGYAPLDLMSKYYREEIFLEDMRHAIIPAEVYAELPLFERKNYGRFAAIDIHSKGYICSVLYQIQDRLSLDGDLIILAECLF